MIINLQRLGIVLLTGTMSVAMAQMDMTLTTWKKRTSCDNYTSDEETAFNHDMLWKTHKNWWKTMYMRVVYYYSDAYTFNPGDAIFCWTPHSGLAKHYVLYAGNNQIVQVHNGTIIKSVVDDWKEIGCDGPFVLSDYYNVDGMESVQRAQRMIGQKVCYDVNTCNAEHFVSYWMLRNTCDNQSGNCPNYRCLGKYEAEEIDELYS